MQDRIVSHFRVGARIGGGGMGVVHRGEDLRLGRPVALKFLPPELLENAVARERFIREARAASALDHPNICTIYEVDETEDGQVFMAMALYEGETLKQRIARGPLPAIDALDLAGQILEGLSRAHERGIVHRDIKPANVLIAQDGLVKLVDFGLARLLGEARLTRTGAVMGTIAYMSPEQVRDEPVDLRSDLWSAGVVLHEMLTGALPFVGETEAALILSILDREPTPLGALRDDVPPELAATIRDALAKHPADRFESANEMLRHLRGISARVRTAETETLDPRRLPTRRLPTRRVPTPPSPSRIAAASLPRYRRRRRLGLTAAAVLVALIAAAGTGWWLLRRSDAAGAARAAVTARRHSVAVLPLANFTGDPSLAYLGEGVSGMLIGQLGRLPGLSVAGRSESWPYGDGKKPAREIAAALGVDTLVEGQLSLAGPRARVELSLLDGTSGFVLWSRSFEADRDELLDLQGQMADELARQLAGGATETQRQLATGRPTSSPRAYDLYLRALADMYGDAHAQAPELLRQALELDPGFALAHAQLARALTRVEEGTPVAALAEAEKAAATAVRLDPELPEARLASAQVLAARGRYPEAIAALRRVTALYPASDSAWAQLALTCQAAGELDEAETSFRAAIRARPDYWGHWQQLGALLAKQGAYAGARDAFTHAAHLAPASEESPGQNLMGLSLLEGDFAAAAAIFESLPRPIDSANLATNGGTAYFFLGRLDQAERQYRTAVRLAPKEPMMHSNLGDLYVREQRLPEAQQEYRRAAELTEEQLAVNATNPGLKLWRVLFRAKAGDCREAVAAARRLQHELAPTAAMSSNLAKAYAVCGERDAALGALRQAVHAGYSLDLARKEDEFRPLLDDRRFAALAADAAPADR